METLVIDWSYVTSGVPGGGEAHPDGRYACLLPGRVDQARLPKMATHLGLLDCPEDATYPRIPEVGSRILAQGHASDHALEWSGTQWDYGDLAFGPDACLYGAGDLPLVISTREVFQAYGGYRALNQLGHPVGCTQTYYDPSRALYAFTDWEVNGQVVGVGQGGKPDQGCVVSFPGEPLRRLDVREPPTSRTYPFIARNLHTRWQGDRCAITVVDYQRKQTTFIWATAGELSALPFVPPPQPAPVSFSFTHPVMVAPFKDPLGDSGAPAEILVNSTNQSVARPFFLTTDCLETRHLGELLGVYSEESDPQQGHLLIAEALETRLLLGHDALTDWTLPRGLRPWDIPALELYRSKLETLDQTVARWSRQLDSLLHQWPGDLCVIPPFYCQGGAPPNELWAVEDVLDGLDYLSGLVNRSPRIKVIAPFAWLRANGITAHPELRTAFDALLAAGADAGLAHLLPVPEPPDPPEPPTPEPVPAFHPALPLKGLMEPLTIALQVGIYFARIDRTAPGPSPTVPFPGWYPIRFDRLEPSDPDCRFILSQPEPGGKLKVQDPSSGGLLSADFTEFGGSVCQGFYLKPEDDWGAYEQFSGWQLGSGGPEVLVLEYPNERKGQCAPSLVVVRL